LECYDSWDTACEAELSRISTERPVYNIAANTSPQTAAVCWICGGIIHPPLSGYDYDEDEPVDHTYCSDAVVTVSQQEWTRGYQQGQVAHLPTRHPDRQAVYRRWTECEPVHEVVARERLELAGIRSVGVTSGAEF